MQGKRPSTCVWCRRRRFLRMRAGTKGPSLLRVYARNRCARPASPQILFQHRGAWTPLRAARSARRRMS